jgi:long-chain acyl-CoA synthetase
VGSIGLPLPGVEIKLVDDSGKEIRTGEVGEILVRGPNVMKGYLNRPEATKEAIKDGWLRTGDLARLDESGFAYMVVRKKNVIIKGGFSIYPREVERFLVAHPKISEAVVIGNEDQIHGEEVHAFVILKENEKSTEGEILDYIREKIAAYKCPKSIHFIASLPRDIAGRIQRDKIKMDYLKKSEDNN